MLEEFPQELINKIRQENPHFDKLIERHDELKKIVKDVEEGREHMEDIELEKLKLEKLKLKDEAYAIVMQYKKEHGM
ncbi:MULTISPECIES: DUF465 domain-containing protein [unclassified Nitratiruptor]|uniref:DUF465 domain-containing protein n=1 Tax=unclassified Nitratiruptor TaxID=2624044 RepID=UPI00191691CA|nr:MULTISPECIES: DUF465 domain-containing protein [unclassified Nitratiruptor]BCD59651.1 hypothetical protein NitYY0810_C0403 [Nitratiruptor sp. YY08-10]BCD63575.1 hypothetical protein NitYY0814_C0403 [Nitratiruptor sp. YY08-14]